MVSADYVMVGLPKEREGPKVRGGHGDSGEVYDDFPLGSMFYQSYMTSLSITTRKEWTL